MSDGLWRYDHDGDGFYEYLAFDGDRNGVREVLVRDANGDGKAENIWLDTDQNRTYEAVYADADGTDGWLEWFFVDHNGDRYYETVYADHDHDAAFEGYFLDANRDGRYESYVQDLGENGTPDWVWIDRFGLGHWGVKVGRWKSGVVVFYDTAGIGVWEWGYADGNGDGVAEWTCYSPCDGDSWRRAGGTRVVGDDQTAADRSLADATTLSAGRSIARMGERMRSGD